MLQDQDDNSHRFQRCKSSVRQINNSKMAAVWMARTMKNSNYLAWALEFETVYTFVLSVLFCSKKRLPLVLNAMLIDRLHISRVNTNIKCSIYLQIYVLMKSLAINNS